MLIKVDWDKYNEYDKIEYQTAGRLRSDLSAPQTPLTESKLTAVGGASLNWAAWNVSSSSPGPVCDPIRFQPLFLVPHKLFKKRHFVCQSI